MAGQILFTFLVHYEGFLYVWYNTIHSIAMYPLVHSRPRLRCASALVMRLRSDSVTSAGTDANAQVDIYLKLDRPMISKYLKTKAIT